VATALLLLIIMARTRSFFEFRSNVNPPGLLRTRVRNHLRNAEQRDAAPWCGRGFTCRLCYDVEAGASARAFYFLKGNSQLQKF